MFKLFSAISYGSLSNKHKKVEDYVYLEKKLGDAAHNMKDYNEAIKHYNNAMNCDDKNMEVICKLSAVYYEKKDYWKCADYNLKALMTANGSANVTLKCSLRLAKAFEAVGDFENAREYYEKANSILEAKKLKEYLIKIKPEEKVVHKKNGRKEYVAGNIDLALIYYTKAMQGGSQEINDAKLFSKRAAVFTKLNLFWLGLMDSNKGIFLNPQSCRLILRRGVLFHKLDIFNPALKDFEYFLRFYPDNGTVKCYITNIEQRSSTKDVRFRPRLPNFCEEYQKMFPKNKDEIQVLCSYIDEFSARILNISDTDSVIDSSAFYVENLFQLEAYQYRRFGKLLLHPNFDTLWRKLSFGEVIPIQENDLWNQRNQFQSMKNVNLANYPLRYGENHVSIGCVDFSELLFANYIGTENDGCLNFVGIDLAVCSIARCCILKKMIENNSDSRSILQVWFSSAWGNETKQEFVKSCSILLEEKTLEKELLQLIQFWKDSYISVTEATTKWSLVSKDLCQTSLYEDLANMRHMIDRVEYARYLFTGFMFVENEYDICCGNSTMFLIPKNKPFFKSKNENFYYVFNFSDNRFQYKTSLKVSMETFMLERMEKLKRTIVAKQINLEFKCGEISTTCNELLDYVKSKYPHTIDWSNLIDYFCKESFMKICKYVSKKETVSYFHCMNWIKYVKGASIIDYNLVEKKIQIRISLNHFFSRHLGKRILNTNYAQIWDYQINTFSITNITETELSIKYIKNYYEYYFKNEAEFKIIGENGYINQSNTTFYGQFTLF